MGEHKAPGKAYRRGMTMKELYRLFPDDGAAREWFEAMRWPEGICCTDCGSYRISEVNHKTMPYRCKKCRRYFSVLKGTAMQGSKIGLQDWALAIYLVATSLKGISSMHLHRTLGVTQKTAWYMLQRIREAFADEPDKLLTGTIEVDEMFVGGKQSNRHKRDRGRYSAEDHYGKKPVVAAVERGGKVVAKPIPSTDANTLTRFVEANVKHGSRVITDDHGGYTDLMESFRHRTVKHSVGEYVKHIDVHTNTVESLWSMFKRGFVGTYHRMSFKHLHRYVNEFAGRKNIRELDTLDQLVVIARGMIGKRMRYDELTG